MIPMPRRTQRIIMGDADDMRKNLSKRKSAQAAAYPLTPGPTNEWADNVVEFPIKPYGKLIWLRDTLKDAFANIIIEEDGLLLSVQAGARPRLWIDGSGWVDTCGSGAALRFVLNTRRGRETLLESDSLPMLADISAHYVAARIVKSSRLERLV